MQSQRFLSTQHRLPKTLERGQSMLEFSLVFPVALGLSAFIFMQAQEHLVKTMTLSHAVVSARRALSNLAPHPLHPTNVKNHWQETQSDQRAEGSSQWYDNEGSNYSIVWKRHGYGAATARSWIQGFWQSRPSGILQ